MSEKRFKTLTIIIEDDTGTVQTHIRSELSAPQLMDKIFELKEENEQLEKSKMEALSLLGEEIDKNEQLKQELQGMGELLQSYQKTIKHDAGLLADASKNGYLPPLNDYGSMDGWICGCCKHFHSGVRDRCDKDNNWVLKDGSCQDFER